MASNKDFFIKKIRKQGDMKIITIPVRSDLKIGDYVVIRKLQIKEVKEDDSE